MTRIRRAFLSAAFMLYCPYQNHTEYGGTIMTKRFIGLILAALLCLSLTAGAWASSEQPSAEASNGLPS